MFPVRWGKRGHSIILGMCTMPKAKVSAGAELSPEISQKMSWWHWGKQQSTMSKKESVWFNQSHLTLEITSSVTLTVVSSIQCITKRAAGWPFDCICIVRANLAIVKELGDRAAQGRTYGNLGNTHYLLGNFRKAVASHEQVRVNSEKCLWVKSSQASMMMFSFSKLLITPF